MRYTLVIFGLFLLSCQRDFEELKENGEKYYKEGNYVESLSCFSQALQKNDTSETILFCRSKTFFKLGDNQGALSDLLKLAELGHNNYKYFNNIATVYFLNEKYDSASVYFEKAFGYGLNSYLSRYLLYRSYSALKKIELAENINRIYFKGEYDKLYDNFEKDFFNEDLFNLFGTSEFVYLMYFPKNRVHKLGEKVRGVLFLFGKVKTQISSPSYYIVNEKDSKDTLNRIPTQNGVAYFSIDTDTTNLNMDSIKRQAYFYAKIKYSNKDGKIRDSIFRAVGNFISTKTPANNVFKNP